MWLSDLRDRAWQDVLEFAWRQWAQLGLSSYSTRMDSWAIDPEALILFTIQVARRDPRLFDEVLDWLVRNRRLLSLQRLRNLGSRFPVDPGLVRAVIAWTGEAGSSAHWPKDPRETDAGTQNVAVFSPDVLGFIGEPDPIFAAQGYLRPKVSPSGKSREPDVRTAVNLAFRLRLLFGPGSRSEVMRVLLTFADGPLDAARIADEAGFAKRNISDTLAAFAASRVVKARWSGNERVYYAYRDRWATLLNVGTSAGHLPAFVSWPHLLPALLQILAWLESEAETTDSEYLISSRARDLIERAASDLEVAGLALPPDRSLPGSAYLPAFVTTVESALAAIEAGS